MCGRTSLFVARPDLEDRFDATVDVEYEPRYNIAPRQPMASITNEDSATITQQEWGLLAPWADGPEDGPRPINARAETAAEKPMFREAVAERRCLVPSTGFFEWQGERGNKQPYRIQLEDDAVFAMAGLWNRWEPEESGTGADAAPLETLTILTTEPNDVLEPIHDRMPVVVPRERKHDWLDAGVEEALELCEPYTGDDMLAYPLSTAISDPSNDDPSVIRPAETEQRDLGDYGS